MTHADDPVVVTGYGAVSSLGATAEQLWQALLVASTDDDRPGIRDLDLFPTASHRSQLAAQVRAEDLPDTFQKLARAERFGCIAAAAAVSACAS